MVRSRSPRFPLMPVALLAAAHLAACGADGGSSAEPQDAALPDAAPPPPVDHRPEATQVVAASDSAVAKVGLHDEPVTRAVAPWSHVVAPPAETVGGRDLTREEEGHESTLSMDIDNDDVPDTLHTFVPHRAEYAFLAWEKDGHCHLAWERYDITRYVFSRCNGAADAPVHVCATSAAGARVCQTCTDGTCEPCDAHLEDGQVVCTPFDDGTLDGGVDASVPADAGPSHPDGQVVEPDAGEAGVSIAPRYLIAFRTPEGEWPVVGEFEADSEAAMLSLQFTALLERDGVIEDWSRSDFATVPLSEGAAFEAELGAFALVDQPDGQLSVSGRFEPDGRLCGEWTLVYGVEEPPMVTSGELAGVATEDARVPGQALPPPCESGAPTP